MSDVIAKLKAKIDAGKITFDPPAATSERLRKELLGENTGTQVTAHLQAMVLELANLTTTHIRISSLVRGSTTSHHGSGRAVDVGNEGVAGQLLPLVATNSKVANLKIDELIFDAGVAGKANRNEWNYNEGSKHSYDDGELNRHKDHIHISVRP